MVDTVPATENDSDPEISPLAAPIARACLDNGLSYETVLEWLQGRAQREAVRPEAWWLGQE